MSNSDAHRSLPPLCPGGTGPAFTRRGFLRWSTVGLGALALAGAVGRSDAADTGRPADDPAARTIQLKKDDHILFFGDSLTALSTGPTGWVTLVREALNTRHPDLSLRVSSVATGGHKVSNLLERAGRDVLPYVREGAVPHKPTIVFIQIGVNDAAAGIEAATFKAQLEELIGRLRTAGAQVVLCSLTSLGEKHDGTNRIDPKLEEFASVARTVAREQKVPLNDLRRAFVEHWKKNNPENKDRGILTYDGNHFNDAGHRFVAEQMLTKLQ
ncbi:MAG: GDSL-type esterase/lipase family protein [Verrucomicrobiota bacterium]|nr:GDSL-type esterase/lipase family protein [Verrucomicrobiota bacterium]